MDEITKLVIGRDKTVLVSGNQKAVITEIVAHRVEPRRGGRRLRFIGNVNFSEPMKKQTRSIILPIIDRITHQLKLPRRNFKVCAVNLGAASVRDVGVDVSGLSAEVPAFIAMLSAVLELPVADDFVSTGHISSIAGHLSTVEGIPSKVEAAKNDNTIKYFLCPEIEKDESLKVLSPNERDRDSDVIVMPGDDVRISVVSSLDQLIRQVFTAENIVLASLREGFFGIPQTVEQSNDPIDGVVRFLTCNNQRRFWGALHQHFLAGQCNKGKELLEAFARFYLKERLYPAGFGSQLTQLSRNAKRLIENTCL